MASGQSLTLSVAEDLGIAIVTGKYSREHPLPFEGELCKHYKVSRSVLREAVKMLTAKGLLSARPRQGTRVEPQEHWNFLDPDVLRWMLERRFSIDLLIQLTQTRLAFEPAAAALASSQASEEQRQSIAAGLARMAASARGDDDALEADIAFHSAIIRAAGNPFFLQLHELIATALRYSIRRTNVYRDMKAIVAEHKRVCDAILSRAPDAAERAMRMLVQDALAILVAEKAKETRARGKARSRRASKA